MNPWTIPPVALMVTMLATVSARRWRAHQITARLARANHPATRTRHRPVPPVVIRWKARMQRRPAMADDIAPTLDELARAIAAGSSLAAAIESLAPTRRRRPFADVLAGSLAQHRLGTPLADALASAEDPPVAGGAVGPPEQRLGMAVLELAARHGGATAASLDRVATAIRERRAVVAERAVQAAQARMSALVLTLLPIGFALWTARTDSHVREFLVATPLGWACLAAGLGLNLAGWAWMRRLIRGPS